MPVTKRQVLCDECLTALANYARQAQKTCELLGDIQDNAPSLDRLLAILEQTQAEDQVQESYMILRQRLFDVLNETAFLDSESPRATRNATMATHLRKAEHFQQSRGEG
jgi:hypothetical protein